MADAELETWKNGTRSLIFIKQYNQRGELHDVMVGPGKVIHISPKERRINQEIAANENQDLFSNGLLTPVRLIETEADAKEIAANPNLMTETEMRDLFKAHFKTFEKRVNEVKNPIALQRLLEIAEEVDAKSSQVKAINERLAEVSPALYSEISSPPQA